jgi:adenine-specific DNA-methyltransferase
MSATLLSKEQQLGLTGLTEQVDIFRLEANRQIDERQRAELGQFMTPLPIARMMASMLASPFPEVSLLDAGAGVGSLLSAAISLLCRRERPPKAIRVTAFEIDPIMVAYLRNTLSLCASVCSQANIDFSYEILAEDFIAHCVDRLANPLFGETQPQYTCAILNPPYRKIQTGSAPRRLLQKVGIETTNLYAGFLALAAHLLVPGGELVAITPRSFCNGPYFRPFREFFLRTMVLRQIHIFDSRQQAFRDDEVLQENIIISAIKSTLQPDRVVVTSSADADDDMPTIRKLPYHQLVHPRDPQRFIHLIPDELSAQVAVRAQAFSATLADLGLSISTGRVVDFRSASFLRDQPAHNTAPLIYPTHINNGGVIWPKPTSKKPNALVYGEATRDLFVPNEHYVLVKRFSSKEERRRIVAAVYDPTNISSSVVGFENHLNYFHEHGRGIDRMFAYGLAAFLNSTLIDAYFRQFNGHTQVNATDLRAMRYPSREQLVALGRRVIGTFPPQDEIDRLVAEECVAMSVSTDSDPILVKKRIQEALDVLRSLGLPRAQQNERSALTLLALLDMTPETPWPAATNPLRGITPMMEFFAQHYGKLYKPNTRETVRRQTVHQFLDAGMLVANPDDSERPINSPKAVYQIEQATLELLRAYSTEQWEQHLRAYLASVETLQRKYAQEREMQRIPVILPSGTSFKLSPGGQNVLVKQLIDEFAARFTPGGEVLYVGDTDEKFAFFAEERLHALGVNVDAHGKMPDVIIYHTAKNWLVLIEAVTSHGPINPKRRSELAQLFQDVRIGIVYVTAFLTRGVMKEYLSNISWETEVWVADSPSHLIHFNGERFLGPY